MKKAFFTLLLLLVNSLCIAYPYIYADDVCNEPYVPGIYSGPDETIIVEEGSTISQNIIQTQTIQKERVGLIRGTAMFVGSAIRLVGNTIGEGFTEGEESYIEDDESYVEGSSSSLQDDYAESLEGNFY